MISTRTWPAFLLEPASVSALAADARLRRIASAAHRHQRAADDSLLAGLAVTNHTEILQEIRTAVREAMRDAGVIQVPSPLHMSPDRRYAHHSVSRGWMVSRVDARAGVKSGAAAQTEVKLAEQVRPDSNGLSQVFARLRWHPEGLREAERKAA